MPEFPTVGDEFAGYLLRAILGQGRASVVFEAESQRLGNVIALKVLAPELAADDIFCRHFIEESRIAASMNHPHVIPIYDVGSSDGLPYIAMRYVLGTDLRQLLAKRGPLPPETAIVLLSQAAQALDAAHRMGLVHQDVKPGNLLIEWGDDDPEHLYLADFGFAKRGVTGTELASAGQFPGTVDYAAPEQIRGLSVYGSADQYSLGCVLYESLTGRLPFERDPDAATVREYAEERFTPPALLRTELPPAIDEVFARVLARLPGDRYNTCREFMQAASVALADAVTAPASGGGSRTLQPAPSAAGYPATAVPAGYAAAPSAAGYQPEVAPTRAEYLGEPTHEAVEPATGTPTDEPAGGPAPGSRRLRARWLVIAAALLLVCGGLGTIAYAALSGGRTSQAKAAGPTSSAMGMGSPSPKPARASALMQVLTAANISKVAMGKLPPSSCVQQGTTTVICTAPWPGVASATFTTYPTLTALYSAYKAEVRSLNSGHYRQNVKNCGLAAPSPYGEITWNHREQHSRAYTVADMIAGKVSVETAMGRMACMMTASRAEDIVWTTDYGKMLGVAIGTGSHKAVWYWWAAIHHNIIFPGTPMDMGGKAPLMSGAPTPGMSASAAPSMSAAP